MDPDFVEDFSEKTLSYPRYVTLASTEPLPNWQNISEDLYKVKVTSYDEACLLLKDNVYVATSDYIPNDYEDLKVKLSSVISDNDLDRLVEFFNPPVKIKNTLELFNWLECRLQDGDICKLSKDSTVVLVLAFTKLQLEEPLYLLQSYSEKVRQQVITYLQ